MTKFPKKTAQGKEGGWDRKSCAKCHGHLTATKGDDQSVDDVSDTQDSNLFAQTPVTTLEITTLGNDDQISLPCCGFETPRPHHRRSQNLHTSGPLDHKDPLRPHTPKFPSSKV